MRDASVGSDIPGPKGPMKGEPLKVGRSSPSGDGGSWPCRYWQDPFSVYR